MKFNTAEEMLEHLGHYDLYSKSECLYVFDYNDMGSIVIYSIVPEEAKELTQKSEKYGDYWGAFLGPGGHIYDSKEYFEEHGYEYNPDEDYINIDWCNDHLYITDWEDCWNWEEKGND